MFKKMFQGDICVYILVDFDNFCFRGWMCVCMRVRACVCVCVCMHVCVRVCA